MKLHLKLVLLTSMLICNYADCMSLVQNSPFIPNDYNQKDKIEHSEEVVALVRSERFEIRGIVQMNNTIWFSVFDRVENKSEWLTYGDEVNSFIIDYYDQESNGIVYTYMGIEGMLQEPQADTSLEIVRDNGVRSNKLNSMSDTVSTNGSQAPSRTKIPLRIQPEPKNAISTVLIRSVDAVNKTISELPAKSAAYFTSSNSGFATSSSTHADNAEPKPAKTDNEITLGHEEMSDKPTWSLNRKTYPRFSTVNPNISKQD